MRSQPDRHRIKRGGPATVSPIRSDDVHTFNGGSKESYFPFQVPKEDTCSR